MACPKHTSLHFHPHNSTGNLKTADGVILPKNTIWVHVKKYTTCLSSRCYVGPFNASGTDPKGNICRNNLQNSTFQLFGTNLPKQLFSSLDLPNLSAILPTDTCCVFRTDQFTRLKRGCATWAPHHEGIDAGRSSVRSVRTSKSNRTKSSRRLRCLSFPKNQTRQIRP